MEKVNEFGKPLWIATLDFQKAFDSVSHAAIWEALAKQGVHTTYIDLLQRLYDGQLAYVQTDQPSRQFPIHRGTKQGDPISPILFNAVIEHIMSKLKYQWGARKYGFSIKDFMDNITNLRYADDILLIARSLPQMRQMLSDVARESALVGLRLHPGKTKILHNSIGYGSKAHVAKCGELNIDILDPSDGAQYLGRVVRLTCMDDEEIASRISKGWAKYGVYTRELTDRRIPLRLRLKLFEAVITPTVLYGSEAWTMTQQRLAKLQTAQRRMLRNLTQSHRSYDHFDNYIDWIQHATDKVESLMGQFGIEAWTKLQQSKKWKWADNVACSPGAKWSRLVAEWRIYDTRPQGRPRTRWEDSIIQRLAEITTTRPITHEWCSAMRHVFSSDLAL